MSLLWLVACGLMNASPPPPPADLLPGVWEAPDGTRIELWFEESKLGALCSACEGRFEAVGLLGPGSTGVQTWNYGNWGPIQLNLVDAQHGYHALIVKEVDGTHARMRAHPDPAFSLQPGFLDHPETRVFERKPAQARAATGSCPKPRLGAK